ncbi:peptidase M16 [candidate division KSB3 bacterium]|uniref:Peptidase M16 n=1 Tax=candidate division KSB3 bacterium TaxID=2044937 RepID=A0A2G6E3T3_9BACT|nr:MAG: peptidase M16 [candidate division KSB3 bacterium]PIE29375.1 MAG: peptidase M16 [candidate division KSB3 bacterium]
MARIHGFEVIQIREIPEIKTKATHFTHLKSGAELLSLENSDDNKVFGISFRTPPDDSSGLPHILEHSVLCGSRKYPLKEPFVELLKGSLNTFLNAFTFPDKTVYPLASQNLKDFYNLIDVYLDAVFYPCISRRIFEQEGWHYELDDPAQALRLKGVVFNEMKGAFSSPDSLLYRYSQHSLFPDNVYGLESGGDPDEIPNLSYKQFKDFHTRYYHPSNSRIFFYGNDDPEERLRFLDSRLRDFEISTPSPEICLQEPFEKPAELTFSYHVAEARDAEKKGMMTVNWLFPESGDPQRDLACAMLGYILVGTQASPLRRALINSGLGEDLIGGGLHDSLRQLYFSTGLTGIAVEDAETVEGLIQETLNELVLTGIDPDTIEAAVNTIEFHLREQNTGSFPRGLSLFFASLTTWLHGKDPIAPLAFEEPLRAVKQQIRNEQQFFESMIQTYLLENPHRCTVLLKPDPAIENIRTINEEARLAEAKAVMTPQELDALVERTRELKRWQETPDAPEVLAKLPGLTLADLEKKGRQIPLDVFKHDDSEILYHDLFTNGILYLDLGFDLHTLPQDLLPYAALFGNALVKLGTRSEDFVKLSQRIGRTTGGIWPSFLNAAFQGSSKSGAWLFLHGKATMNQVEDLLGLMRDVLLNVTLDNRERVKQIVLETKARKESGLVPSGHVSARTRLGAHFHESAWFSEQSSGVSSLFFIRKLASDIEEDWPLVLEKLEEVRRIVINRSALVCNVTLDGDNWEHLQPTLRAVLSEFPAAELTRAEWKPQPFSSHEGLTIPAQVNFVAKGANLYKNGYTYHGSSAVITQYLRSSWLWEKVRVQGGAYGGFCSFNRRSGLFSYLSYRDPNLLKTLENYDLTAKFLQDTTLDDEELTKTIIGAIGQIDDYQLPDAKGYSSMVRYLLGENDEFHQNIRDEVLSTTVQDFKDFAEVLERVSDQGDVVVLGSEDAIQAANAEHETALEILTVL